MTNAIPAKKKPNEQGINGNVVWRTVEVVSEALQRERPDLPIHLEADKLRAVSEAEIRVERERANGRHLHGSGYTRHIRRIAGLSGCTLQEVERLLRIVKTL